MNGFDRQLLVGVLTVALLAGVAAGQADRDPSSLAFLLDLPGEQVSVRYSPGSLERAARIQQSWTSMLKDFQSWTRQGARLIVFLLSREEWEQAGYELPYGVPMPAGGRALATSAWGDAGTVGLWRELTGSRLPSVPDAPMRGAPEEVASLVVADLLAVVETARLLLEAGGFSGDRPWVDGVLTHAVALSMLQKHQTARLPEARMVFSRLSANGGGQAAHPLSTITAPPSLAARLWCEAQFFAAASLLSGEEGGQPAKPLLKLARRNGGRLRAADLLALHPALDRWLAESFAAG